MSIKVKLLKEQEWKQQKRIFLASPDYPSWLWQSDHVVNIWPNIPDTGSRKPRKGMENNGNPNWVCCMRVPRQNSWKPIIFGVREQCWSDKSGHFAQSTSTTALGGKGRHLSKPMQQQRQHFRSFLLWGIIKTYDIDAERYPVSQACLRLNIGTIGKNNLLKPRSDALEMLLLLGYWDLLRDLG